MAALFLGSRLLPIVAKCVLYIVSLRLLEVDVCAAYLPFVPPDQVLIHSSGCSVSWKANLCELLQETTLSSIFWARDGRGGRTRGLVLYFPTPLCCVAVGGYIPLLRPQLLPGGPLPLGFQHLLPFPTFSGLHATWLQLSLVWR